MTLTTAHLFYAGIAMAAAIAGYALSNESWYRKVDATLAHQTQMLNEITEKLDRIIEKLDRVCEKLDEVNEKLDRTIERLDEAS